MTDATKELPLQGFARALGKLALVGCALSLLIHAIALLGFHPVGLVRIEHGLFFGS